MFKINHPEYPARITTKDPFYYQNVPYFETKSLLKNKNFVSDKEFGDEIILVNLILTHEVFL